MSRSTRLRCGSRSRRRLSSRGNTAWCEEIGSSVIGRSETNIPDLSDDPISVVLFLRKIRVCFHFLNLLGVALAVPRDQQNPLIGVHRSKEGMRAEVVAQVIV